MLVAIVLGNRLNDDGSLSEIMLKRLNMALSVNKLFAPDKFIVSGGVANKKAKISEAQAMLDFLVKNGISTDRIVTEDKSLTTKQNAEFSVPLAADLGATEILLCTSSEHMQRSYRNPIKLFENQLATYPEIILKSYCES